MSDIAAANSTTGSAATIPPPPPTQWVEVKAAKWVADEASPTTSSSSKGPVDVVDLSDHAKAVLARAKSEQVAADKLKVQLEASKGPGKNVAANSEAGSQSPNIAEPSGSNYTRLTDRTDSQLIDTFGQGHVTSDDFQFLDYVHALYDAHISPDGKSVADFHVVLNDVFTPSTPEETAVNDQLQKDWAQANPEYMAWAKQYDPDYYAHLQAYVDGTVTHLNVNDIPDLDLHNTVVIDKTSLGISSGVASFTYNHHAAIFNDPTTDYTVSGNGDVIGFKKPTTVVSA